MGKSDPSTRITDITSSKETSTLTEQAVRARQYWLWVTRPEFYLDADGYEREDLDPGYGEDTGGWWTCHKDTRKGDLALLWRTTPLKDIGYLMIARSDAYTIGDDEFAGEMGWQYGCEYEVLYKLTPPITIRDLRADPSLYEWSPLRQQFQRSVFRLTLEDWKRLTRLITSTQVAYGDLVASLEGAPLFERIRLEEELEEELAARPGILRPLGYQLELYYDERNHQSGRQFVCRGHGGRIDLLCRDNEDRFVVVELKNVRANQNTFGQVASYMGWVQAHLAEGRDTIGLVISRGFDARFEAAMAITDKVRHVDIAQLGFD